uniref:Uncharacterized protein n=1 Tax=Caulerpa verticillata TaxID=177082 RepID=A0A386B0B1_9CHLO|nr:hypothetical protein [Caulerpa verticillata]AYC65138.1 hypothetical protein [Caulerpa verticillata]
MLWRRPQILLKICWHSGGFRGKRRKPFCVISFKTPLGSLKTKIIKESPTDKRNIKGISFGRNPKLKIGFAQRNPQEIQQKEGDWVYIKPNHQNHIFCLFYYLFSLFYDFRGDHWLNEQLI